MNPEDQNQPNNPNVSPPPDQSYKQEMQNIVNPVDPNQPALGQTAPTNNSPKLVKIADLITNINLITWLLPGVGILVSVAALVLGLKTKKFSDKRAQLRIILAIVGLVLSIICTGAVAYLIANNDSSGNSSATVNTYPEETRTEYLEGCSIVFDETTCNCMLEGLENNYTAEDYVTEEAKIYDGTASDEYMLFLRDNQLNCEPEVTTEE